MPGYARAVADTWKPGSPGVIQLPSGRRVRGRALRRPLPGGDPPHYALYLLGRRPAPVVWDSEWIHWPDFGLPSDTAAFARSIQRLWDRAETERVEIACGGGRGRTGTALACLLVIDGLDPREAVSFARTHYARRAVETPWQRRFVTTFRWPPGRCEDKSCTLPDG